MSRYIIAPSASRDLDEISDYFALHNIDAGERLLENFNKKCRQLAEFPNMGRSYRGIEPTLRGVPLSGYIIFYRVIDDGIEIVRVVSGHRDLRTVFSGEGDD